MLGVTINYDATIKFLEKELHTEWVYKPFLDQSNLNYYFAEAMRNNGKLDIFNESYSLKDMEELSLETEGKISEFTFGPGPNEGYFFLLKMESGQILRAKTFDRNTFELFMHWINRQEAVNQNENRRKILDPIPVGTIVYMVNIDSPEEKVLPVRLEYCEATENSYPLLLRNVNPNSNVTYPLYDGWEGWPNIFFRIEDALTSLFK